MLPPIWEWQSLAEPGTCIWLSLAVTASHTGADAYEANTLTDYARHSLGFRNEWLIQLSQQVTNKLWEERKSMFYSSFFTSLIVHRSHSFSNSLPSNNLSFISSFTWKRCQAIEEKALKISQDRWSISTSHDLSSPDSWPEVEHQIRSHCESSSEEDPASLAFVFHPHRSRDCHSGLWEWPLAVVAQLLFPNQAMATLLNITVLQHEACLSTTQTAVAISVVCLSEDTIKDRWWTSLQGLFL